MKTTLFSHIKDLLNTRALDTQGFFLIENYKVLEECFRTHADLIQKVYITEHCARKYNVFFDTFPRDSVHICRPSWITRVSSLATNDQLIALVKKPTRAPFVPIKNTWTLLLDGVRDPRNLGAIMRTADWFGVQNIVCSAQSVGAYHAQVLQSAMGAWLRVAVHYTKDWQTWLESFSAIPLYVASAEARESVYNFTAHEGGFLAMGNESQGVSEALRARATQQISIPRVGQAESLNVSVATGIMLSYMVKATK